MIGCYIIWYLILHNDIYFHIITHDIQWYDMIFGAILWPAFPRASCRGRAPQGTPHPTMEPPQAPAQGARWQQNICKSPELQKVWKIAHTTTSSLKNLHKKCVTKWLTRTVTGLSGPFCIWVTEWFHSCILLKVVSNAFNTNNKGNDRRAEKIVNLLGIFCFFLALGQWFF